MTWATRYTADGDQALALIVVWRGTPGWFARGGASSSGGGAVSGAASETIHASLHYGGIDLDVELDLKTRTAVVAGKTVALGDSNVILVDKVDDGDLRAIVGTLRLDASFPRRSRPRLDEVVRRSSEIMTFLRCDDPPPGNLPARLFAGVCAPPAAAP